MRIISTATLKKYYTEHADVKEALVRWRIAVEAAEWKSLADIKKDFPSVDYIGNQRYVFNIKGNNYRLVVVIKFTPQWVFIRFVGTHAEYDKIDCSKLAAMCNFNKEQYEYALKRIEDLIDVVPDCDPTTNPQAMELSIMSEIVMQYEDEHFSMKEDMDAINATSVA